MKVNFLLVILLNYILTIGIFAQDIKKISFDVDSVQLLKSTWGRGDANLKILIISENSYGRTSRLDIDADGISASLYEKIDLSYDSGITIPIIYDSAEVSVIILNESENSALASLVFQAITNIAKRKTIRELNKLSKGNWLSLVVASALDIGTSYAEDKILEYLKENEIGRIRFHIEKGDDNWSYLDTKLSDEGNVRISYSTNFVGKKEESLIDSVVNFFITEHDMNNITVIGNLMWQDEMYTEDEIEAYKNEKAYGKVLTRKDAIEYCEDLELGNYDDWMLPSSDELYALFPIPKELKNVSKGFFSSGYIVKNKDPILGTPMALYFSTGILHNCFEGTPKLVRCMRVKE